MKTITFIAITLLAGAIAGTILGVINQVVVEPYIERAIELEMQNTAQSHQAVNPAEFTAYRFWQKGGEIVAGTILGLSIGSLFGIVLRIHAARFPALTTKRRLSLLPKSCLRIIFEPCSQISCKPSCSRRS